MYRSRLAVEDTGLDRTGRERLLRRQLQQALQPGVLRPQPDDLVAQRRELVVQTGERQDALVRGPGRNRHDSILSREPHLAAGRTVAASRDGVSDRW